MPYPVPSSARFGVTHATIVSCGS